jgi:hypothetical protein
MSTQDFLTSQLQELQRGRATKKYQFEHFFDFRGGLNVASAPDNLQTNELRRAINIELFQRGGFSRRKGISEFDVIGTSPITRIIEFEYEKTGVYQLDKLILTKDGNLHNLGTSDTGTVTSALALTLTDTTKAWTVDAFIGRTVTITSAIGVEETRIVASNTADTLTITLDWTTIPDDTYTYKIADKILNAGSYDEHLSYSVYKNKVYIISNGKYQVYDGTTLADVVSDVTGGGDGNIVKIRKCKYLIQRQNRFFACGNPDEPNALYFSELGKPAGWRVADVINALTDDADKITGLAVYHGSLLVFKARTIYAWFGYTPTVDAEFVRLNVHTGTKAHRSIVNVGNLLFYLGEDGVYAMFGTFKDVISTKKISKNITPVLEDIQYNDTHYYNHITAIYTNGTYKLSVPTDADNPLQNNLTLVIKADMMEFEQDIYPWVIYTGWNINAFLDSFDGNLYSYSSTTGRIHLHEDIYNDLGSAIEILAELPPMSFNFPVHVKKFRRGYVALRQNEDTLSGLTITAIVDYREREAEVNGADSLIYEEREWDLYRWDWTDLVTRRFNIKNKGKRLTLIIEDDSLDEQLTVYGFGVEYKLRRPSKD